MKQILQSLKTGATEIMDVPLPQVRPGYVLIRTQKSLISSGTERMLVDFGKSTLINKIRKQPEKMRMVIDKIKTDGLLPTLAAVQNKLDQLLPMGYCNVGMVLAVGQGVSAFSVGDRVVSNGAHAEIVSVPQNLCCKVDDAVTDESAVFTVLGAIALQGIRLSQPTLGESFVVMGLGLIGLLTVQLLRAHGCHVLAIDLDASKVNLARQFGADALVLTSSAEAQSAARVFSRHRGVDGVLITAATKSSEPLHLAADMCRKRGRIVLIGTAGLNLSRADFYAKELSFQVSCSYGPGRYDPNYEEKGNDYPLGFVRWTEQRNFEAFLDMLANQSVQTASLISHRFSLTDGHQAYEVLSNDKNSLGIVLDYGVNHEKIALSHTIPLPTRPSCIKAPLTVGFIGAGNYANRILIPAFKKTRVGLKHLVCSGGVSGAQSGKKFGFEFASTDPQVLFSDENTNAVVIASRHDNHARFVCDALSAKKHVFVEKPLCLTLDELDNIIAQAQHNSEQLLMIGFNRRFSPLIQKIKSLLVETSEPKSFIMTVNAGEIAADHWTQDRTIGGGRIIGEACHFIDLLRYLADSSITSFHVTKMDKVTIPEDKISISLTFADGSFGVIHYLANGHRSFPKERLEIFTAGRILQLDNFRQLHAYGWPNFKGMRLWRQDKGQIACVAQFVKAIQQSLKAPIPLAEIIEVSRITLQIAMN